MTEKIPRIDSTYWKPHPFTWQIISMISWGAAYAENLFVPNLEGVQNLPYRIFLSAMLIFLLARLLLGLRFSKIKGPAGQKAQFYFALGLGLIVWDVITAKTAYLALPFFPSLAQIIEVIVQDYNILFLCTVYSLRLLVIGFSSGVILGLTTGVLLGWYIQWKYWMFPVVKVVGVIPATAWIPITMIIFPSSLGAEVFLISLCVWFPVAFMTCSGIQNVPKSYFEAAKTLGGNELFLIFKVAIPCAMPSIFTGIYTATGISFATLVVSEMIGARAGLGWYINWAKGWGNYSKVFASIVIMAVLFSIIMAIIFKIRDRVLIWQKGLV